MKALKPSHRENKRYLLLAGKDADKKTVEQTILDFIGILGYAKASPVFIKHESKTILAVNRKALNNIRAAFLASDKDISIAKVSGGIGKVK